MKIIQTPRLKLIALSQDQLQLYLTNLPRLEDELGLSIIKDEGDAAVIRAINIKLSKMAQINPAQHLWLTYWVMAVPDSLYGAGMAGFKGIPNEKGEVEIGYGIAPEFRRRGYTTEAVQALIQWAFQHPQCTAVLADTDPANIPSQRVLAKVGMHIYAETDDSLWWRIDKAAATP